MLKTRSSHHGLIDLAALQAMPAQKALAKLRELKPENIFTAEQLGSQLLLENAANTLISRWRAEAGKFARHEIEDAIIASIKTLRDQAKAKTGTPIIKSLPGNEFTESLLGLLNQIPASEETAREFEEGQQAAFLEAMGFLVTFTQLLGQGRTTEAVGLAQAFLLKLLEDIQDAVDAFRGVKDSILAKIDEPETFEILTEGDALAEPEARDVIARMKALVIELFDGSSLDTKTDIIKSVSAMVGLFNDLEVRRHSVNLKVGSSTKKALDANLRLERRHGLGFVNPESAILDDFFASRVVVKDIYRNLSPKEQMGLNQLLKCYTGDRLFDLQHASQTSQRIQDAVGGMRGFATISTLISLGFFERMKSDIIDVCQKVTLRELNMMTAEQLEEAVAKLPRTPYAGDAFRTVLDED